MKIQIRGNREIIKMSKRDKFKQELLELREDDEALAYGEEHEIIYLIDDIVIYGGFEGGMRGIDHNILLSNDVSWEDILQWGTVVVPETESYIGDSKVSRFEKIGYERLPLNRNHIVGGM